MVLKWSRARKRYERQGLLVEEDAREQAIRLPVVAHIRHRETEYYALLVSGWDRQQARAHVNEKVSAVLGEWRGPRPLTREYRR